MDAAAAELGAGTGEGLGGGKAGPGRGEARGGGCEDRAPSPRSPLARPRPALPGMERCGPSLPRARKGGAGPAKRLPPHLKDAELVWGWGAHTVLSSASHKGATWAAVRSPSPAEGGLLKGRG